MVGTRGENQRQRPSDPALSRRQRLARRSRVDRDLDRAFLRSGAKADSCRRRLGRLSRAGSGAASHATALERRARYDRAHARGRRCGLSSASVRVSDRTETSTWSKIAAATWKLHRFAGGVRALGARLPRRTPATVDVEIWKPPGNRSHQDSAFACTRNVRRVFSQNTILVAGIPRLPSGATQLYLRASDVDLNQAFFRVEGDRVAVLYECDRPADGSLRRNMSDEPTPRTAGEARVGDQGDGVEQSLPDESRRWREHLRHARTAFRTFVPDNDDITSLDLPAEDCLDCIMLGIEHPSRPLETRLFDARDFGNAALGREITLENLEMARFVHRIRPWADHFLVAWWFRWYIRQLLGHRAAGDGHALAMESAMVEQHSQHLPHATDAMKVYSHIAARWLQVAENGRLPAHALEVVQRPFDASRFRDCENVKHGVGRALGRHDCRNRVPDGLPRDDVARLEILLDRLLEHSCGFGDRVQLFLIFRRHEWRVNQTQAERGSRARHSVRGVLSPTDANARARVALDALEVFA